MPARFWYDSNVPGPNNPDPARGDPSKVLKGLANKKEAAGTLRELEQKTNPNIPKTIAIPATHALYLSGTTNALQAALASDLLSGIECFSPQSGKLAVWYIRRAPDEGDIQTIVCIAGRGEEKGHYWTMDSRGSPEHLAPPKNVWKEMPNLGWHRWDGKNLPLNPGLLNALEAVRGEAAFYPSNTASYPPNTASQGRVWHWADVDSKLQVLQAQHVNDQDKHVRGDGDLTKLYVEPGKHVVETDGAKRSAYANGVKLIKNAIDRHYGTGEGKTVFDYAFQNFKDTDGLMIKQIEDTSGCSTLAHGCETIHLRGAKDPGERRLGRQPLQGRTAW